MKILQGNDIRVEEDCAVMLGKFDGMHRGHQTLLDELKALQAKGLRALVFTFAISPKLVLNGKEEAENRYIMTNDEKRAYFEKAGVDYLVEFTFDSASRHMSAEDFVTDILVDRLKAKAVIVGEDFGFGYKRSGNVQLLKVMSASCGFDLIIKRKLKDADGFEISSTRVTRALINGEMETVSALLGRPFSYGGTVTHGAGLGHTFGFPTVNIAIPDGKCQPPYGVYAARVRVDDKIFNAVTDIGVKPTVSGANHPGTETFILDFKGDLYGEDLEVMLYKFLRSERKFDSVELLTEQISHDIENASEYLKNV